MAAVKSPAMVLATYLEGQDVGEWPENSSSNKWTLTYHKMPDEGDVAAQRQWITIVNTGGWSEDRMRQEQVRYYRIQVIIRGSTDDNALERGKVIVDLFDALYDQLVTVDGFVHRVNHVKTDPITFLKEEKKYQMRVHVINGFTRITQE